MICALRPAARATQAHKMGRFNRLMRKLSNSLLTPTFADTLEPRLLAAADSAFDQACQCAALACASEPASIHRVRIALKNFAT